MGYELLAGTKASVRVWTDPASIEPHPTPDPRGFHPPARVRRQAVILRSPQLTGSARHPACPPGRPLTARR